MKVFIAGGENQIIDEIVPVLRSQGHDISILVADAQQQSKYQQFGALVVVGNINENGRWIEYIPQDLDCILNLTTPVPAGHLSLKQIESHIAPEVLRSMQNITYVAQKKNAKRLYQLANAYYYKSQGIIPISERKSSRNPAPENYGLASSSAFGFLETQKQVPTTLLITGHYIYNSQAYTIPVIPRVMDTNYIVCESGENLIQLTHIDDLVGAIAHLVTQLSQEPVINIVDNKPISQQDLMNIFARVKGSVFPIHLPKNITALLFGDAYANSITESYELKNDILRETGYWLKFPDYSAGFAHIT